MIMLHIIDSLSIAPYLKGNDIIDVGSGAGLPGIPLAIFYPEKKFVLLDAQHKKTRFLTQAIIQLSLSNVEIVTKRVENFHPATGFDTVLTRAFAPLSKMLALTQHLLKKEGQFLAMKGKYPQEEIRNIPEGFFIRTFPLMIEGLHSERHLICVGMNSISS
jgi:16S rRNA (guanine527-N7)-methyltransferase